MPFELIALLLAGLSDAPTLHALRHETAASYNVTANCWNEADGGRFEVNADVHPLKVGASLREVLRQIERLRTAQVPEAELRSAKTALLAHLAGLLASNEGMSHELAGAFLDGLPADYIPSLEGHILAISGEEVREVAARYLSGFPGIAVHGPHVDMHTQLQGIGVLIWR